MAGSDCIVNIDTGQHGLDSRYKRMGTGSGEATQGQYGWLELLLSSLRQNQNGSNEVAAAILETEIWYFRRLLPISPVWP